MEERQASSMPLSNHNHKRAFEPVNDDFESVQLPSEGKKICTESSPSLETEANLEPPFPPRALGQHYDGQCDNSLAADSNQWSLTDLPRFTFGPIQHEATSNHNPGDAMAIDDITATIYPTIHGEPGLSSDGFLHAYSSTHEVQTATLPSPALHHQIDATFPYSLFEDLPISGQDASACSFPASETSLMSWTPSPSRPWDLGSLSDPSQFLDVFTPSQIELPDIYSVHYSDHVTFPQHSQLPGHDPGQLSNHVIIPHSLGIGQDHSDSVYQLSSNHGAFDEQNFPQPYEPVLEGIESRNSDSADTSTRSPDLDERSDTGNEPIKTCHSQTADVRDSDEPYNICFGMLVMDAFCSTELESTTSRIPMTTQISGSLLKFNHEVSTKYAGVVDSPTLSRLQQDLTITLAATFIRPQEEKNVKGKKQQSRQNKVTVEIVLYGLSKDTDTVGDVLSKDSLFLQHPNGRDTRVPYFNPQYLLPPDSQMPEVEGITFEAASKSNSSRQLLDERCTAKLLELFNDADGPVEFPEVKQSSRLQSQLKEHQMKALAMMTEKERGVIEGAKFNTLWDVSADTNAKTRYRHVVTGRAQSTRPPPLYGGLLADEMGLGKTLSILALIAWFLDNLQTESLPRHTFSPRATLIVAPTSTIPGWQQQIKRHFHRKQINSAIFHGSARNKLPMDWASQDIVITTYETLRSEYIGRPQNSPMYSEQWARVVLDEAHHIRNRSSKIFEATCAIPAKYRWCLTGTPIHNRLDDYGALMAFVRVTPFAEKSSFELWFTSRISENHPEGLRRLKKLVAATCLRRTKETVKDQLELPPRTDEEISIELEETEQRLYSFFKDRAPSSANWIFAGNARGSENHPSNILSLINILRLICNHGEHLLPLSALKAWRERNISVLNWSTMPSSDKSCALCKVDIGDLQHSDDVWYESCPHMICSGCKEGLIDHYCCSICNEPGTPESQLVPSIFTARSNMKPVDYQPSTKVKALLNNLHEQYLGHAGLTGTPAKSVIFSCWTKMLDMIEIALQKENISFKRIDGQKSLEERTEALDIFNTDPSCTVMLASIGSVAEGVDLKVANYVHLMEPQWNPMLEEQALDRVHRIGQTRDVVTFRYVVKDSIENYVRQCQKHKLDLISKSLG